MAKKLENSIKEIPVTKVNRLSIQMSSEQLLLLKRYVGKNFSETGVYLTSSHVMRVALQEFLQRNLHKDIDK